MGVAGLGVLGASGVAAGGTGIAGPAQPALTAREVFGAIKTASGLPWDPNPTDDRIIYGDRDQPITGIATGFFSSLEILETARDRGLNYVIPHEASFYERYDDFAESALRDDDPVLSAKKRFCDQNGMVIQRMHGHAHAMSGDFIGTGLIARMGWSDYRTDERSTVRLPEAQPALQLGRHIKQATGRRTLRMFGDPELPIRTLSLSSGMPGENRQIAQMELPGVDAVYLGEVREPEVLGYAQDLVDSRPMVVFLGGHTSEDFGMGLVADWLKTVFPALPVEWIPTVDPYTNPA